MLGALLSCSSQESGWTLSKQECNVGDACIVGLESLSFRLAVWALSGHIIHYFQTGILIVTRSKNSSRNKVILKLLCTSNKVWGDSLRLLVGL